MVATIRGLAACAFLAVNTVLWCLPIYACGAIRPLLPASAKVACGGIMLRAMRGWVSCARRMATLLGVVRLDARIVPRGGGSGNIAPQSPDGWYLVISNHQSWADILVLVFALHGRIAPCKFFTKRQLIWMPLVGLAMWLLDYPLVRRYGRQRLHANPELAEHDRQAIFKAMRSFRAHPTSVLIFAEGTRFTAAKHAAQKSPYRMLLRPKSRGCAMAIEALAGRLDGVIDATIAYPGPPPTFWDFLCGRSAQVHLRAEVHDVPAADADAMQRWLEARWRGKDAELLALTGSAAETGGACTEDAEDAEGA